MLYVSQEYNWVNTQLKPLKDTNNVAMSAEAKWKWGGKCQGKWSKAVYWNCSDEGHQKAKCPSSTKQKDDAKQESSASNGSPGDNKSCGASKSTMSNI